MPEQVLHTTPTAAVAKPKAGDMLCPMCHVQLSKMTEINAERYKERLPWSCKDHGNMHPLSFMLPVRAESQPQGHEAVRAMLNSLW